MRVLVFWSFVSSACGFVWFWIFFPLNHLHNEMDCVSFCFSNQPCFLTLLVEKQAGNLVLLAQIDIGVAVLV